MTVDTIYIEWQGLEWINHYPANVENMVSFLPLLANGGWDLIQRLKG